MLQAHGMPIEPVTETTRSYGASATALDAPQAAPLERGGSDLSTQQSNLILDLTQVSLDLIGIVDPTGAADVASGAISLGRGDLLGAGMSALGALLPYAGDLAKLGKLPKLVETLGNVVAMAKQDARFAAAVEPMLTQLKNGLAGASGSFDALPAAARNAIRTVQAKVDEFFATAKLARGEGAFATAATSAYTPAGAVLSQAAESSCVAASIRMLLANGSEVPEAYIRQAANVDNAGGLLSDSVRALDAFGAPGYRAVNKGEATIRTLENALERGPLIALVRTDVTGGAHALVVDAIRDGKVYIRDPYPPGAGASYAVDLADFQKAWTGCAVLPP
jgi:Peptidase C39 family